MSSSVLAITVLFAVTGGILLSGGLIIVGSWLRARLALANDPPPELAWLPPPLPELSGSAAQRRQLHELRLAAGQQGQEIEHWQATIAAALEALQTLPDAAIAATAAGDRDRLEKVLRGSLSIIERELGQVRASQAAFDEAPPTADGWDDYLTSAQLLADSIAAAHQHAQAADQRAEAAWAGMPEPGRARLWWLVAALVMVVILAVILISQRPPTGAV